MIIKRPPTPEQISEKEEKEKIKLLNRAIRSLKTRIRNHGKEHGLQSVKLNLEYLELRPGAMLPSSKIDRETTLSCYRSTIKDFEDSGSWLE